MTWRVVPLIMVSVTTAVKREYMEPLAHRLVQNTAWITVIRQVVAAWMAARKATTASIVTGSARIVLEKTASQTVEHVLLRTVSNHGLVPAVIKYVQITVRMKYAREPAERVTCVLQASLATTAIQVSNTTQSFLNVPYVKGEQQTPWPSLSCLDL